MVTHAAILINNAARTVRHPLPYYEQLNTDRIAVTAAPAAERAGAAHATQHRAAHA